MVPDRNDATRHVGDDLGDRERRDPVWAAVAQGVNLVLGCDDPADAGTDDHARSGSRRVLSFVRNPGVGQGLIATGALEPVARRLGRFWKRAPALALLATLIVGAALSAFMNNTPIVVLMLPMLIGAAIRSNSPTSGILLPMGLGTIIGGMSTTIGTNTPEMRSASFWTGAFDPWASSTSRTIWARAVSRPTLSARKRKLPLLLIVPATTPSPGRFSTGIGSPVSIDSSMALCPS